MVRSSLTRSSLTLITDWLSGKGIMGQNWTSALFRCMLGGLCEYDCLYYKICALESEELMLNTRTLIYAICREMLPYQARDYCRSHACLGKPPTFALQHTSSCSSSHRLLNLPSCQEAAHAL